MVQKKYTQTQQVIDTLRKCGGYATLGNLYHLVDTKSWATKTPNESIRRIVQKSDEIFRIQPGLWALEECRDEVMRKFDIQPTEQESVDNISIQSCNRLIISTYYTINKRRETIRKQNIKETIFSHFSCFPLFLWFLLVAF